MVRPCRLNKNTCSDLYFLHTRSVVNNSWTSCPLDPSRGNGPASHNLRLCVVVYVCHRYVFLMCVCVHPLSLWSASLPLFEWWPRFHLTPLSSFLSCLPPECLFRVCVRACVCELMLRLCAFQESLYNCSVRLSWREERVKRGCVNPVWGIFMWKNLFCCSYLCRT